MDYVINVFIFTVVLGKLANNDGFTITTYSHALSRKLVPEVIQTEFRAPLCSRDRRTPKLQQAVTTVTGLLAYTELARYKLSKV